MKDESANNTKKSPKSLLLFIIIGVLAALSIFLIIYLSTTKSKFDKLYNEKEYQRQELMNELDTLIKEHEAIKVSYGELSMQLEEKDSIINAKADEIKKLLGYEWEYVKIKKKFNQLQKISKSYVTQMDSLYTVNATLIEENTQIKKDIQVEKKKNVELSKEKAALVKKLDVASVIKAYEVDASCFHLTGSNEKATDKAKRTNLIRVCFSLLENALIETDKLTVYARIALPDGTIITEEGDVSTFVFQGNVLQYTMVKTINYNGTAMNNICID